MSSTTPQTKAGKASAPRQTIHRARIPADAMTVLVVQVIALLGVWGCAIAVSFTGLVAAAGWANVHGDIRYTVPLFIDGILVGASLAYLVARERKDRPSALIAVLAMVAFCGLSITGNAVHALGSGVAGAERLTGVALAVAAPVAILVTTELLARTVISSPDEHQPAPRRQRRTQVQPQTLAPQPSAPTVQAPAPTPADPASPAPVRSGRPVAAGVRGGRDQLRARALVMAAEGLSDRAIAAALSAEAGTPIAHSTVGRWRRAAQDQQDQGEQREEVMAGAALVAV